MDNPETRFELCDQRKAFLDADGHQLVLGGPGAGKTTIGLLKARRYILSGLDKGQSVLFLSFSNAATRRIMSGVSDVLEGDIEAHLEIKTLHSLAWEILRAHGYLLSNCRRLEIVSAQDADVLKAGLTTDEWATEQLRLFNDVGCVTYDMFAPQAARLLNRCAWLRTLYAESYPLILIDEFQDTDEDQWELLHALAERSSVIALGDEGQRIYEWRPGVSPYRLSEFEDKLEPGVFDFGSENNRSPGTGISAFGRALLDPEAELPWGEDVDKLPCTRIQLALGIKLATRNAIKEAKERTGYDDVSIAIAARGKALVRLISDALDQTQVLRGKSLGAIPHDVLIDQSQVMLAARVTAFLLEAPMLPSQDALARTLDMIADMHRSGGKVSHIETGNKIKRWADKIREGKTPSTKLVKATTAALEKIRSNGFTGNPIEDWIRVRKMVEASEVAELTKVADHVRFLRILRRGSAIEDTLTDLWKRQGNYTGAAGAVDEAILKEQVMDSMRPPALCTVMTMHQLKGREFDAVVIVEDEHRRFLGQEKEAPYMDTRRLLQVSITRARKYGVFVIPKRNSTFEVLD